MGFSFDLDLDYEEERDFHRQLSLMILALSPVVVLILLGFRPPTYGKHVEISTTTTTTTTTATTKQTQKPNPSKPNPSRRGNEDQLSASLPQDTGEKKDGDAVDPMETETNNASLSLRRRRQSLRNDDGALVAGDKDGGSGSGDDNDNDDDDDSGKIKDPREQQKQKQQQSAKKHWLGPLLPTRWSWVVFESPCCIWVILCVWDHYRNANPSPETESEIFTTAATIATTTGNTNNTLPVANQILLGWFFLHYCYRSIWYPLVLMKPTTRDKGMPLGIVVIAWCYCTVNGYLQARDLTRFRRIQLTTPRFGLGMLLALIGFYIVATSDHTLVTLKAQQEQKRKQSQSQSQSRTPQPRTRTRTRTQHAPSGSASRAQLQCRRQRHRHRHHYAIPRGGWFECVSSPHYFGELVEWTGFFVATNGSLASLSFVVWTASNLAPRALQTHRWYLDTFVGDNDDNDDDGCGGDRTGETDYSKLGRKAIIPGVL